MWKFVVVKIGTMFKVRFDVAKFDSYDEANSFVEKYGSGVPDADYLKIEKRWHTKEAR